MKTAKLNENEDFFKSKRGINWLPQIWLKIVLFFLPMTSFLVLPSVQGTTPTGFLICLALCPLTGFFFLRLDRFKKVYADLFPFFALLTVFFFISRPYYLDISYRAVMNIFLINGSFILPLVMIAHITQTIYLFVAIMLFVLVRNYYNEYWDRYIFAGAWFLVIYGYSEWFLNLFGINGDFLANRTFGSITGNGESHTGSFRQSTVVLGFKLLRFKSFTGEPSMFAITAIPYLVLSITRKKTLLSLALISALLLTFSTTAYIALLGILFPGFLTSKFDLKIWMFLVISIIATVMLWFAYEQTISVLDTALFGKFSDDSGSGVARTNIFSNHFDFWLHSDIVTFLFGLGFGTARSTDLLATLLVNIGLIGTGIVTFGIFKTAKISYTANKKIEAIGLIAVFVVMMGSVSEFSYLPPWLLAGVMLSKNY